MRKPSGKTSQLNLSEENKSSDEKINLVEISALIRADQILPLEIVLNTMKETDDKIALSKLIQEALDLLFEKRTAAIKLQKKLP